MATPAKVGLFGGKGGSSKDVEKPRSLTNIEVWSSFDGEGTGGVINGIRFAYVDIQQQPHTTEVWGTAEGQYRQIPIDRGDYVEKFAGTIGRAGAADVVSSLAVTTHNGVRLSAGDPSNVITGPGGYFSVPLEDASIVAFFAHSSAAHLNAVGVYVLSQSPN